LLRPGTASVVVLVLLALVAAATSAGAEAIYYHLKVGVDLTRVLATNWTWGIGLRPAWVVGGAGLAFALGAALRPLWNRPRSVSRRVVGTA
jgi:sulfoxide reductase heme-binding subunit YedZ